MLFDVRKWLLIITTLVVMIGLMSVAWGAETGGWSKGEQVPISVMCASPEDVAKVFERPGRANRSRAVMEGECSTWTQGMGGTLIEPIRTFEGYHPINEELITGYIWLAQTPVGKAYIPLTAKDVGSRADGHPGFQHVADNPVELNGGYEVGMAVPVSLLCRSTDWIEILHQKMDFERKREIFDDSDCLFRRMGVLAVLVKFEFSFVGHDDRDGKSKTGYVWRVISALNNEVPPREFYVTFPARSGFEDNDA